VLYPDDPREPDERQDRPGIFETVCGRQAAPSGALDDLSAAAERTHGTPDSAKQYRQYDQALPPKTPYHDVGHLTEKGVWRGQASGDNARECDADEGLGGYHRTSALLQLLL